MLTTQGGPYAKDPISGNAQAYLLPLSGSPKKSLGRKVLSSFVTKCCQLTDLRRTV